jgi:hypothetical protein
MIPSLIAPLKTHQSKFSEYALSCKQTELLCGRHQDCWSDSILGENYTIYINVGEPSYIDDHSRGIRIPSDTVFNGDDFEELRYSRLRLSGEYRTTPPSLTLDVEEKDASSGKFIAGNTIHVVFAPLRPFSKQDLKPGEPQTVRYELNVIRWDAPETITYEGVCDVDVR